LDKPSENAKTFSITRRIIAAVVTCQILLTLGLVAVAVLLARAQFRSTFDSALKGNAMGTLALLRYVEDPPHPLKFDFSLLPPASDPQHPALFEIHGADERLIVMSPGWKGVARETLQFDRESNRQTNQRYFDFTSGGAPYRGIELRGVKVLDVEEDVVSEKVDVYYASSRLEDRFRLERLAIYVGSTSLLLLIAANWFAIWSIRRGLHPLQELAAQAGAISVHNWDFRPPSGAKLATELSPLSQAIETVLIRLKDSFRRQRDFTNDAAHELKTSVAIVKSTLQSLLQRPRTQREYEIGLRGLLEDCARAEDLLERMLRLARIEQLSDDGALPKLATTELTSTCEAAMERIRTLADARNVALEFETAGAIQLLADPEDLELIWLNLLENAVQYSPAGSKVKIRVQANRDSVAQVSVIDSGPGIPALELPRIFERFHRGDPSRARSTGGFGLGLAICKALVDAYGGKIEAINLPEQGGADRGFGGEGFTGHGTEIRVQLPIRTK
jgi:signal transduction histidine kinase